MKKRFHRLITISGYMRDVLVDNQFPAAKIEVLPNFTRLDEPLFDVPEEDAVLFVGRFTPEKGLLELLDAVSRTASKPKLVVVGKDGVLGQSAFQSEIERRANDAGVSVEFNGWVVGDDLRRAFARSKVVAVSSVWPEPFGLVGIEAMAQGKPVVAFDCGGIREWLDDGRTGYAVPHGDLDAFASRIDQLLTDDEGRLRMRQAARADALRYFTPAVHTNRLLGIYKEVLDESAADRPGRSPEIRHTQCGIGVSL
jgi:glycosyltransferase involved in cell wall biosynthesis